MVTEVETLFPCTPVVYSVHVSSYLDNLVHLLREFGQMHHFGFGGQEVIQPLFSRGSLPEPPGFLIHTHLLWRERV